jgi:hypothetical protein
MGFVLDERAKVRRETSGAKHTGSGKLRESRFAVKLGVAIEGIGRS